MTDNEVPRRDFLKNARTAVGMLAYTQSPAAQSQEKPKTPLAAVTIGSTAYTPVTDYPIQPKRYSEVKLRDDFWQPRVARNAQVTIPFEVQKLAGSESRWGLNGGVLEAAILFCKHTRMRNSKRRWTSLSRG